MPRGSKSSPALEWADWFNQPALGPIGNISPTAAEDRYYAMLDEGGIAA
jgi:putative transposase